MSDPDRLLDQATSPLTRELLSAARSDEPSEALLGRTLVAVGAATSIVASAGTSAAAAGAAGALGAATSAAKGSSVLFAVKWLSIGALGGAVAATAAYEARDALRAPPTPSEVVTPAPKAPEPELVVSPRQELAAGSERSEPSVQDAPPPPRTQPAQTAPGGSSLAAEVAALDAARQALARGDTGRALSLLDAHRERFPEAHLLPEALHIRMEALYAQGERAAAVRIAERILAGFPRSPHAARARRVAEEGKR